MVSWGIPEFCWEYPTKSASRVGYTNDFGFDLYVNKQADQLPLFLNANTVAQVLGVSISSAYELMHETGFPALRIGNRIVVPKEKFCQWVDAQTGGDV